LNNATAEKSQILQSKSNFKQADKIKRRRVGQKNWQLLLRTAVLEAELWAAYLKRNCAAADVTDILFLGYLFDLLK